jgi:hypothetical protein
MTILFEREYSQKSKKTPWACDRTQDLRMDAQKTRQGLSGYNRGRSGARAGDPPAQLNGKHEAKALRARAEVCCPRNGQQASPPDRNPVWRGDRLSQ